MQIFIAKIFSEHPVFFQQISTPSFQQKIPKQQKTTHFFCIAFTTFCLSCGQQLETNHAAPLIFFPLKISSFVEFPRGLKLAFGGSLEISVMFPYVT
jgi:hypothetical protein